MRHRNCIAALSSNGLCCLTNVRFRQAVLQCSRSQACVMSASICTAAFGCHQRTATVLGPGPGSWCPRTTTPMMSLAECQLWRYFTPVLESCMYFLELATDAENQIPMHSGFNLQRRSLIKKRKSYKRRRFNRTREGPPPLSLISRRQDHPELAAKNGRFFPAAIGVTEAV